MHPSNFTGKNWYRNYPIRGSCSLTSLGGAQLPTDLIVGAKLTSNYLPLINGEPFISQIVVKDQNVSVTVSLMINGYPVALWYGGALITSDNQTISMTFNTSRLTNTDVGDGGDGVMNHSGGGFIVIGNLETVKALHGSYRFEAPATLLELSCVVFLARPAVSYLDVKGTRLVGVVTTKLANLTIIQGIVDNGYTATLDVISTELVASYMDHNSKRLTCLTPVISRINSVTPDGNGNIEIWGIEPVTVTTASFGIALTTPNITFATICPPPNVPNYLASDEYVGSILSVTQPEWKVYWDQYQN